MIAEHKVDGYEALVLGGADADGIEATFVPAAGMVGCSLQHGGQELLGQRGGLATYVKERSTMGIPLLHPWANRVASRRFFVAGREVDLSEQPQLYSVDHGGQPIHGLLAAAGDWSIERYEDSPEGPRLVTTFDFAAHANLMRVFPFPHRLHIEASIAGRTLTIATTVIATGEAAVPIAFGYHPYFRLPGIERSMWTVEIPVGEQLVLDVDKLPTGERVAAEALAGPLGSRTFDDAFLAPPDPFVLEGGGRRIEVSFGQGYPFAQVYAPDDDDVIAFEPMTAPTNALITGSDLNLLQPGDSYEASFSITVTDG